VNDGLGAGRGRPHVHTSRSPGIRQNQTCVAGYSHNSVQTCEDLQRWSSDVLPHDPTPGRDENVHLASRVPITSNRRAAASLKEGGLRFDSRDSLTWSA
jgi:hypothetical protein